jgi:hypothetical protein
MVEFEQETPSQRSQRIADQYRRKALQSSTPQEVNYNLAKADEYEEKARKYREQGE